MDKKIIAGILLFCLVVLMVSVFPPLPENAATSMPAGKQFLPWQIETTAHGGIKVFGVTLGESTLRDVEVLYRQEPEISLFVAANGELKVEAYYDKVVLGGFSSKMVMVLEPEPSVLDSMAQRGTRIANLGGKRRRISLATQDQEQLMQHVVTSLTYLSRARLDADILLKRFGQPGQLLSEQNTTTTHWLYPELGLDIALNEQGHAVLQYVLPQQFSRLVRPLVEQAPGHKNDETTDNKTTG